MEKNKKREAPGMKLFTNNEMLKGAIPIEMIIAEGIRGRQMKLNMPICPQKIG
ncbi:MAG TPA: hypothetical protein GXX70_02455 [Tepidimicrobium sp.]|nr:hypothetical protein [Tepidimicrobium sp.]